MTHAQLIDAGFSVWAIKHRLACGRLHRIHRGVYSVGSVVDTDEGRWMAAVLACSQPLVNRLQTGSSTAVALSHWSAAALWGMGAGRRGFIDVSILGRSGRLHRVGIVVHRRAAFRREEITRCRGIPVLRPASVLIDLASRSDQDALEAAISKADLLGLISPVALRLAIDELPSRPGTAVLRRTLDRRTFHVSRSKLERRFLPIARKAGLPKPQTIAFVNGFEVDFWWPDLGLVVETDGLTYHRTPAQQARDRLRDQTHAAAGIASLRFTHGQVFFEPAHVERILKTVAARRRRSGRGA